MDFYICTRLVTTAQLEVYRILPAPLEASSCPFPVNSPTPPCHYYSNLYHIDWFCLLNIE